MTNEQPNDLAPQAQLLRDRVSDLKGKEPNLRIRDVASRLEVGEGQLVALRCGVDAWRLDLSGRLNDLIEALPTVGRVMVLTRNETCVHERKGIFGNIKLGKGHGIVLNREIDLRLFLGNWVHGFWVRDETPRGERNSLQFFDAYGTAMHKIYVLEDGDRDAFRKLVNGYVHGDQTPFMLVEGAIPPSEDRPDEEINADGFLQAWSEMTDVHQYMRLLTKFGISRRQSMRLAAGRFADQVPTTALCDALTKASDRKLPIMVFVGNRGCVQIHTGTVKRVERMGDWLNVLDPDFNLHVREDRLAEAHIVRRPTVDGTVTALELFDVDGTHVISMFGERGEGRAERPEWREILTELSLPQAAE